MTKAIPSAGGFVALVNWNWKVVVKPFWTAWGVVYQADPA